jgi:hypothetical protein
MSAKTGEIDLRCMEVFPKCKKCSEDVFQDNSEYCSRCRAKCIDCGNPVLPNILICPLCESARKIKAEYFADQVWIWSRKTSFQEWFTNN